MRCPLCGGPVHEENGELVCEIGHEVTAEQQVRAAELRLAEALWMAIEALDNESESLRVLQADEFADEAARQARQLREFARRHASRLQD